MSRQAVGPDKHPSHPADRRLPRMHVLEYLDVLFGDLDPPDRAGFASVAPGHDPAATSSGRGLARVAAAGGHLVALHRVLHRGLHHQRRRALHLPAERLDNVLPQQRAAVHGRGPLYVHHDRVHHARRPSAPGAQPHLQRILV